MRLCFQGFEVDLESGQLLVAGDPVALERRAFEMLRYLAQHPNRLISKDELISEVWQARSLSDGAVMNAAAKLRKAFGQAQGASEPIETLRGRGYKLHATPRTAAAAVAPVDPFVGREPVLQSFDEAIEQARQGQGQLLFLTGEPGIGKTRSLDELSKRARSRGFSVWEGAAYDGGAVPAYWPWIEILRAAHADMSRATFRQHLPGNPGALARLMPELLDVAAEGGGVLDAAAESTRFRLFDELTRFVASASSAAPRLIIADDAHWADAGTIELFAYAARALKKRSVLFALAMREHSGVDEKALSRHAKHLALAGLLPREVQQLGAALAPAQQQDAALWRELHARTQGNPFIVRQLLELAAHTGVPLQAASLPQLPLPRAVRTLLQQRVAALPEPTVSLLRTAAAIGRDFDLGLLARAHGQRSDEVLRALAPALRGGIVAEAEASHHFAFTHVLLRDATYDALTPAARGQLHARLAEVLEQRAAALPVQGLGELARHHLLAVPVQLTACVEHCVRAAAAARERSGYEAAASLLTRASEKLASEGGDPHLACELLFALGHDHFCAGDVRSAWRALSQGAALAAQLPAPRMLAQLACRLAAWLELGGGDEAEVRAWVDRALQLLGETEPQLRAALLAHRAEVCFELPSAERHALLGQADALAQQHAAPPEILLEIALCRVSLRDPTQLTEAGEALQRYRELARQHARVLPAPQRLLHAFAAELSEYVRALVACELAAADGVIERCKQLAEQSQVAAVALGVELMQASRALGDGRLDDLAANVQQLREGSTLAGGFSLVWASYALRLVAARGGLASLAGASVELPAELADLRPTQQMNGRIWVARLNVELGAPERARALLASIPREQLERMPVRYGDLGTLCCLAEIYAALGDTVSGAEIYAKLLPYAERNAVGPAFEYDGAVAHYLGILARLLDQPEQAASHFACAERIDRKLRMPPRAARLAR